MARRTATFPEYADALRYAKRKYRKTGHFTMFYGPIRSRWFALPFDGIEPNAMTVPFVFEGKRWRPITLDDRQR